jgi:hypothetical protein
MAASEAEGAAVVDDETGGEGRPPLVLPAPGEVRLPLRAAQAVFVAVCLALLVRYLQHWWLRTRLQRAAAAAPPGRTYALHTRPPRERQGGRQAVVHALGSCALGLAGRY